MMTFVLEKAKEKNNIYMFIGLFIFFFGLYIFLDFEGNTNYAVMTENFGLLIVSIHILINLIIAILSSFMVGFSIINQKLTNKEPEGSNAIPFLTFIFGLLTFGCTGCVVAFFTAVGIAFTPIILPAGNMVWKLLALLFVVLGYLWITYRINNMKCEVKAK